MSNASDTAAEQAQQIGMNHDGMHFFPAGSGPAGSQSGLLVLNHEHIDEALLFSAVDLSGRPFLVFDVPVARTRVSNFDLDMLVEFFRAFAFNADVTLHVKMHYGANLHHISEAVFKAVGRALAQATRMEPRMAGLLPSTKDVL